MNNIQQGKVRIPWIDNIRMFAMLLVVYGHSPELVTRHPQYPFDFRTELFIVSFNMALFIFISGYTSFSGLQKIHVLTDVRDYVNKTCRRIIVPTISFTVLNTFLIYSICRNIPELCIGAFIAFILGVYYLIIKKFNSPNLELCASAILFALCFHRTPFWFLPYLATTLIGAAIAVYLTRKLKLNNAVFLVLFTLIMMICKTSFYATVEFIIPFVMGMYLRKNPYWIGDSWKKVKLIEMVALPFIFVAALTLFYYFKANETQFYTLTWLDCINTHQMDIFIARQLCAVLLILFFFILIKNIFNKSGWFTYCGMATLCIYPAHVTLLSACDEAGLVINTDNLSNSVTICIIFIVAVSVTALSMGFYQWTKSYSITRRLFLGLSE